MAITTGTGPLSRFLRFTTQKEPVLSAASLVAIALAIVTRFVPLTDDDLQLLALLLLPFAPAVLARLRAWSPASVDRERSAAYQAGQEHARLVAQGVIHEVGGAQPAPKPRPVRRATRKTPQG